MKKVKYSVLALAVLLPVCIAVKTTAAASFPEPPDIKRLTLSEAFVLMDADTGQVLLERNMRVKMYPASITKIMTALLALESGRPQSSVITMSHDAVWSVGRDTSHIALDETEQLTLEQALYALAIASANDAANGIAELVGGTMENFSIMMTERAKELGAADTNFKNAHGLPERMHSTTAYDMAKIMAAAAKTPGFSQIFTTITYEMPQTNRQPETRFFHRKNSLVKGPFAYSGLIAEKTGWTGEAGFTYAAAAKRDGVTLVAVLMNSPSEEARWSDCVRLFDYGFDGFALSGYSAGEFAKESCDIGFADGTFENVRLVPEGDFDFYIAENLKKEDIEITYEIAGDQNGILSGSAVFSLKPGLSDFMYPEIGQIGLLVYPGSENTDGAPEPVNERRPEASYENENPVLSGLSKIYGVISIILQILGGFAVIMVILYIRRYIKVRELKRKRRLRRR